MREISKEPRGAEAWASFTDSILSALVLSFYRKFFWRGRAVHLIFIQSLIYYEQQLSSFTLVMSLG
jgi:hypothetical protein